MKAAHIVPDAFQFHTYVGGGENYPSPLSHASHWVCVYLQDQTDIHRGFVSHSIENKRKENHD